jgi:glycine cleavage system T protein
MLAHNGLLADPALAVPVGADAATTGDLEVELVGLNEPRRREDLEPVGGMYEFELAIGRLGRALENECATAAAPSSSRPHVHGAAVRVDVLPGGGLHHESHEVKFRLLTVRDRAQAVVIGGGVGGCSILYWLARLGWDDVVLVERAELTSGSTFHSAGLVGQLRSTLSLTKMMTASVDLYRSLEEEVGLETGWREVGSLRLASSPERMEEISRQAGWAKTFGLPLELVSPADAQELFPPMTADGVLGAAFLPTDGYIDPSQLTLALAEGARRRGAEINRGTRVTGMRLDHGRVAAVETDRGDIETEIVVNAGGMYASEIGALAGVNVPIVPMAHEYLITKPAGLPLAMPTMRDPSLLVYFRPESGGLIMGGYERHCAPWALEGIPADFNSRLLDEDWPRFEELMENAVVRVPSLAEMEVVKLINGPEAFTPDGEFILGPSDVRGFWVAAGFCAHGLAGAGGMGKLVAEWIVEGTPSLDVWHMDSRRFGTAYRSPEYTLSRTKEIYETYYDVKYPGHERSAGRPLRVSPAYARLEELGAAFGEKSGWERANWFEPNAARGDESLRPRGWAGKLWSPAIGGEHLACRESAALFDETSFAKLEVSGEASADFLERLCANRVARGVGQVTYTQMLNAKGGIECDFTVTRLGEDRFRIVTGTAFGQHDLAWLLQHAPDDGAVHVADVTSQYACYGLWGPQAREILQPLTTTDLSNVAFPYMRARELALGRVPCLALRVTYVGELGWELYCRAEFGLALWDTIWEAGRDRGLVAGGYKAIDSLRLEKGYRVWGADITPEDTPFEAGLDFAVKLDKEAFIGREALIGAREPHRLLRCLTLDDSRAVALGSEPVRVGGELVGRVTSGGYGYTVGRSIAYAYLPNDLDVGTNVEVEIFGEWVPGVVADEPLFDPRGERIRA